ncbi:MAG: leucine-rich repeat protein, partial [Clostridia bacterium]|nr:leucine-rich repeat protein [Clostridia bacterium]
MKKTTKLISILLVLAMLLSMAPLTVFAATVEASGKFGASGSNLTWSLDSDGVLTVSGSGAMEDFANVSKVPWYSKITKVKTVVIESGVTNIGKDAFYGVSSLVNATISDTVTSIGNRAFSGSGLTNFEFSDAGNLKTIGNSAFNSTQIKNMVIPDGVTTLGSYVFGYGPIQSVTIPASVTSVGNYFFEETSSLNEVIFLGNKEPETIGDTVFLSCSSLAYVSVPADYEGDTFSNMKVAKAAASVAEVNGQGFATLADAISAAQSINGAVLKLLSHISIDSGITIESGNFTIDLNGKELFSNGYFLLRVDGADVTIVDSAGGGIFNATNDQGNIVLEVLSGSANILGGTFNSAGYPATVRDGTLKLTGKDFVLNGNWRIGWYGGSIDLSACTADEVRIQACADGLQASAVTLPDGWGLFKTDGTPCTDFVKNDIYVAKAGFKVTASVNPAEGGTVEGAGTYSSGATVTLTASAASGYRFVNWIENGEEVSTSAVYTFTASKNRELTANFEIVPHTHSFTYSASGDTITAVCENTDGNCPDSEGTLTILAPADLYADGTTAKEATIENNLVDTSVAISYIIYSAPYGLPPKDAGTYTASVTVGGATATVEFTLLNHAAKVTDKDGNAVGTYKTFEDAITAAEGSEGSTITLLDDITLTKEQNIRSGKFTLDLNGKNLINENGRVLYILEEADLTIKDSGEGGTIETKDESVDCIYNYGKLTVESGIIKGDGGIRNFGVLYFNDGTVEADNYPAIANYNDSTVYVYDGVLKGGKNSGAVENGGKLYVYGGEIESIVNVNNAYISGGKIDRDDNVALNLLGGTVEITGGSFTGTDRASGYYSGTPYGEWTVYYGEGATLTLKGGEFPNGFVVANTTANTFLAEGYAFYDKDGNKISVADDAKIIDGYVQVKEHFVASVTDKDGNAVGTYKTFADAITAAQDSEGSTVTLLDDVTLTEEQDISSGKFTLDLNGKTLLNETAAAICIESDADVTIKDSGEGGTIESKADTWNTVYNYGTLTVESGIIKGEGGISNSRSGTLNFKSGKIEADTYYAIGNYGTAYIYNGSFKSVSSGAIENRSDSTVYVYGGEFSGSAGIVNHSTAYIEGGEFTGNSYAALNLHGGTVEVTGGSFTGTDFASGSYSGTPYGEYTVYCNEGASLILKGGEFPNGFVVNNTTANTFLAEGYYYKDADGKLIDVADDAKVINGYVKVTKGADLSEAVVTVDKTEFVYNGQHQAPAVTVTISGKTLTENVDYAVNARKWENDVPVQWFYYVDAGVHTSVITGLGDYTGTVEKEFVIKPATVDIIWEGDEFYYTGNPHKVTAKYVDVNGDEIDVANITNGENTEVGKYIATAIVEDANYTVNGATINHAYEIKWYDGAPDATVSGTKGENGWYTSEVTVTAPEGYAISTLADGIYGSEITFGNEENAVYYLRQTENGYIAKVELGEIKCDLADPAAEITMAENKWNSFFNTVTFGYFFKETQSISITASDETSGIAKIEYVVATEEITDFENAEWIEYTEAFTIQPNSKNVIYAKATDNAGRYVIVNSDGIVVYTNSTLDTSFKDEVVYVLTKNASQAFNLNLNGNTVAYVKIDETVLTAEDYEVLGNMIMVSDEVLENLAAGEYVITVGFNPMGEEFVDGDAPAEVTIPLTVKKADVTIEISDFGKVYDGKPVTADYKISKSSDSSPAASNIDYNETVEFKVKDSDDSTYTTEAPVNAGDYTVRITVAETEKITSAEVTADFKISKKNVTATATAPDKVYDGTVNLDLSKVIITLNGVAEGDDVEFTIIGGAYFSPDVNEKVRVVVSYDVSGEDTANYEFSEGVSIPEMEYYPVMTFAAITAKDISDGFIILGDALTYNGTEQTQTVEKVLATGTAPEVTYTVSGNKATNVGVYLLTVTGTGNFTGEAKIAYEIAVDVSGLDYSEADGYYWSDVKSTDKDRIEYVYNQIRNASTEYADEDKKAE